MANTTRRHDAAQARPIWPPEPGFFRLRLVRLGWPVPARIIEENGLWHAVIDGDARTPDPDPAHAQDVARIWHSGHRIDQPEYDWLIALKQAALIAEPDHPACHPTRPINHNRLSPIYPRTPHA